MVVDSTAKYHHLLQRRVSTRLHCYHAVSPAPTRLIHQDV
jgi:hypothetical protein